MSNALSRGKEILGGLRPPLVTGQLEAQADFSSCCFFCCFWRKAHN